VLVDRLLSRGVVGPATNIRTDYHLLEAAGIVGVRDGGGLRHLMTVVKKDVVRDGLELLRTIFDADGATRETIGTFTSPAAAFVSPEQDREGLVVDRAVTEITDATVLELRREAQRAARNQEPF
jgi:hypothetical protein